MIKFKALTSRLFSTPRTKGTLSIDSLYKNIESAEVASIYLAYVDIMGRLKGIAFNPEIFKDFYLPDKQCKQIESIQASELLPGCTIRSNMFFNRHSCSFEVLDSERQDQMKNQKVYLHPDMSTARYWLGNKILILSHLYHQDENGEFKAHPLYHRNKLIEQMNAQERLREIKIERAGLNFYLYSGTDSASINWTMSPDKCTNFNEIDQLERNSEVLDEIAYQLINSGLPVSSLRGAEGNSQYEISLSGNCSVLEMCDRLTLSKAKLKEVAESKKKAVTTMALPYADQPGNLIKIEHPSTQLKYTQQTQQFLASNLLFLAPNPNSFKRLKLAIAEASSYDQISQSLLSGDSLTYLAVPILNQAQSLGGDANEVELSQFKQAFPKKFEHALDQFSQNETPYFGKDIHDFYLSIAKSELKVWLAQSAGILKVGTEF